MAGTNKASPKTTEPPVTELQFKGKKKVYYDRLIALREGLLGEMQALSGYSLTANKQAGEELADVGSDNFIRDMELGLMSEEGRTVQMIDEAIRRLANGTYGTCQDCGEKIQEGRLEALPYAVLCVNCKAAHENDSSAPAEQVDEEDETEETETVE